MNNVLILSNHYRRSCFFESTMRKLYQAGFRDIWIQDTGASLWGPYRGPASRIGRIGYKTYDEGMVSFKREKIPSHIDTVLFIDNDCFINSASVVTRYLEDFKKGQFQWACHHISAVDYKPEQTFLSSTIEPCPSQTFESWDQPPYVTPVPHWENAFLMIDRQLWDKLTPGDVSHGRRMVKAAYDLGAKMGSHKAEYRRTYSHFGDGWFHVGALMIWHNYLEENKLDRFNSESFMDMSRLGYFFAHESVYPGEFPLIISTRLKILKDKEAKAKEAWSSLTSGTCLENWEG